MLDTFSRPAHISSLLRRLHLVLNDFGKDKILKFIKEKGGPYKKCEERLDELLNLKSDKRHRAIRDYWQNVASVPKRNIYLFVSDSIINTFQEELYTDLPPRDHYSGLSSLKKSSEALSGFLAKKRISSKTYVIFLDPFFEPTVLGLENYSVSLKKCVPETIRGDYLDHYLYAPAIWNVKLAKEKIKSRIRAQAKRKNPRFSKEELKFLSLGEQEYTKILSLNKEIIIALVNMQMERFCNGQNLENKLVCLLGSEQIFRNYSIAFGDRYSKFNPYIDKRIDSKEVYSKGGSVCPENLRELEKEVDFYLEKKQKSSILKW